MPKRQQLIEDIERLRGEIARVGAEVFSSYTAPEGDLAYWTIEDALLSQKHLIVAEEQHRGAPVNLTTWPLLEDGEFLMVYDTQTGRGRALTERDLEYIGGDGTQLTPAGMRRWYLNRKSESEYLVSDANGLNIWRPE